MLQWTHTRNNRGRPAGVDMKLKQRVVVLCAVLLLLGLAKIFLLDGGEGSAASRRDLRAFRRVRRMRLGEKLETKVLSGINGIVSGD